MPLKEGEMLKILVLPAFLTFAACDAPVPPREALIIKEFTRCVTEGGEVLSNPVVGIHACQDQMDWDLDAEGKAVNCRRNGKPTPCTELHDRMSAEPQGTDDSI